MAKSIVSVIVGIAVDDGFLSGFDHTVKSVFPNMVFFENKKDVTIGDLLNMSAGLDWKENTSFEKVYLITKDQMFDGWEDDDELSVINLQEDVLV